MKHSIRSAHITADYQLLADTAMLAGEIMMMAGAETCRVEDTITRILQTSGFARCDAYVVPTGIMITMEDYRYGIITLTRRIQNKQTNLGNVDKVNAISRNFCAGIWSLDETFEKLSNMESVSYPDWQINLAIMICAGGFACILGGGWIESVIAALNGIYFMLVRMINRRLRLNSFVLNMAASFFMSLTGVAVRSLWVPNLNLEPFIAGAIMVMLPGVAMTNGIRDTLEGDFVSGSSRMIEALVIAASLALGIGVGMAAGHMIFDKII